ncbi:hypothetical protein HK102_003745 [Quaeritorhiza haematococci]|nr:hypothetical protein HK102_003745 [Quaeritorhiza haematococci]
MASNEQINSTASSSIADIALDIVSSVQDGATAIFFFQLLMVSYMFSYFGKGKAYWRILLAMSICGCIGITMENLQRIVWVRMGEQQQWVWFLSIAAEPFFICSEFGVIALNLLRFRAVFAKKTFWIFFVAELLLFLVFVGFRFRIGALRFNLRTQQSLEIWYAHTPAFALIAVGSLICSVGIIIAINKQRFLTPKNTTSFLSSLFKSSLFILLMVDLVTILLTIAVSFESDVGQRILRPFLLIKSGFAMILAIDAVVMKQQTTAMAAVNAVRNGESTMPPELLSPRTTSKPSGLYDLETFPLAAATSPTSTTGPNSPSRARSSSSAGYNAAITQLFIQTLRQSPVAQPEEAAVANRV